MDLPIVQKWLRMPRPGSHGPIGRSWSMRLPLCPDLRECHKGHEKGSHKYTCLCPDFRECQNWSWRGVVVLINTRIYDLISESARMGHEKGSYKCIQYLWQRVWLRPLEVVRHWNDVCLHLQSCRQLASEIVVFLNLRVVCIRKKHLTKEAFKQGKV